jgi:hypothetical protein
LECARRSKAARPAVRSRTRDAGRSRCERERGVARRVTVRRRWHHATFASCPLTMHRRRSRRCSRSTVR